MWVQFVAPQNNYNSNIFVSLVTDHHDKYNNNENVWNISGITKMWHRDIKWANAIGKMVLLDLPNAGLPQIFNMLKRQNLWSAIQQGMPVLISS